MGAGCVCVPSVAFRGMPLVWFNHGSDVDLNSKCAWHQIPDKGTACVVAVQSSTDSTYWRLNSFRFIRLIEPTHSKSSTFKCINLQWMIIRIPSSASLPGLYNAFVLTVNDDWVFGCNNDYFLSESLPRRSCILLLLTGSSVLPCGLSPFFSHAYYCIYTLRDTERMHMITKVIDHMATRAAPKWESHPELHPRSLWGRCPDYWVTLCRWVEGPLQLLGLFVRWW